ncbi:Superoxide dismutase 1 copper chaperone [Fusarium oxysporum f. sp. albedinis]|nr:Superoxide dismutase 1 copper chaperone [Fusarium oxysporum f. sp. albedinis]
MTLLALRPRMRLGQAGYGSCLGLALIWELDWKWALTMDGNGWIRWEWGRRRHRPLYRHCPPTNSALKV